MDWPTAFVVGISVLVSGAVLWKFLDMIQNTDGSGPDYPEYNPPTWSTTTTTTEEKK